MSMIVMTSGKSYYCEATVEHIHAMFTDMPVEKTNGFLLVDDKRGTLEHKSIAIRHIEAIIP